MAANTLGGFPYTGACFNSIAYILVDTARNRENLDFNGNLQLSEDLVGAKVFGAITSAEDFEIGICLSNFIGLTSFWVGLDFNKTNLEIDETSVFNSGISFADQAFSDKSFFNNLFESPWNPSIESSLTNDLLPDIGTVVFENFIDFEENENIAFNQSYHLFYNGPSTHSLNIINRIDTTISGFLHREDNSRRCFDGSERAIRIVADDIFIFHPFNEDSTIRALANGILLCQQDRSLITPIESNEQFNSLAEILFFEEGGVLAVTPTSYWLGMTLNQDVAVVDNNTKLILNPKEAIQLVVGNFEVNFTDLPLPVVEDEVLNSPEAFALVLTRFDGRVYLEFLNINNNVVGAVCRRPLRQSESGILSDLSITLLSTFGSVAVLLVIVGVVKFKYFKKEQESTVIEAEGSVTADVDFMTLMRDDDTFTLSSGISELQRRRSGGDYQSVVTTQTDVTQATEKDTINHTKVKSVVSKYTNYGHITEMMLQINNLSKIKGATRKKAFAQRVSTILKEKLSKDFNQIEPQLQKFDAEEEPPVPLEFYINRIMDGVNFWYQASEAEETTVGTCSLLLGLHFLRKMTEDLGFIKNSLNIHKTLAILVLVAAKFLQEKPLSNSYWASVSGITSKEVSELEDIFCFSLGIDFSIDLDSLRISLKTYEQFDL